MPRIPALPLALAAASAFVLAAGAARAGDPSRNLDEVDSHVVRDVDDAATGRAEDLDQNLGSARSLEEADRPPEWVPPACEDLQIELGTLPEGSDRDAWAAALGGARAQIDRARGRLAEADAEYTYARNRQRPRGEALKQIIAARDSARSEYATARCRLPELVAQARRAGVSADVWRAFPASLE